MAQIRSSITPRGVTIGRRPKSTAAARSPSDLEFSMLDQALCQFVHQTGPSDLPPDVLMQAQCCLIDTLGAALAGRRTALSQIVHDFAADCFGGRGGLLWQDGREVSPPGAALANAATIDAMDIHDGHSLTKGHAGAAVVPAAFATLSLSAETPVTGREFLTSLAIGYEIALRSGIALHASAADYHSSGAWNALGCAAITARRLRLNFDRTLHSLGIAEYHGPRSPMMKCIDAPAMIKDGSGWGAMTGVTAALLAARGFSGAPVQLLTDDRSRDHWQGLGRTWQLRDVYFKPHPVCRWAQPAIEGAIRLVERHAIDPDEIVAIRVETFHEATRLSCRTPSTTEEAQYSLPFPVAVALCHGTVEADHLDGDALSDSRVLRLSKLVELVELNKLSREFPGRRFAHVSIQLRSEQSHRMAWVQPRWESDAPPTASEIAEKFCRMARHLPVEELNGLVELLQSCAELPDMTPLLARLARQPGRSSI